MIRERLLVGWDLVEEPIMLPVILVPELELGMGLSPYGESYQILYVVGLIVALDRHAASQR